MEIAMLVGRMVFLVIGPVAVYYATREWSWYVAALCAFKLLYDAGGPR